MQAGAVQALGKRSTKSVQYRASKRTGAGIAHLPAAAHMTQLCCQTTQNNTTGRLA